MESNAAEMLIHRALGEKRNQASITAEFLWLTSGEVPLLPQNAKAMRQADETARQSPSRAYHEVGAGQVRSPAEKEGGNRITAVHRGRGPDEARRESAGRERTRVIRGAARGFAPATFGVLDSGWL